VEPHSEYAVSVWRPILKCRQIRKIPGKRVNDSLKDEEFNERLSAVGRITLEVRITWGDLMQT